MDKGEICTQMFNNFKDPESKRFWDSRSCFVDARLECLRKSTTDLRTNPEDMPITMLPNGEHLLTLGQESLRAPFRSAYLNRSASTKILGNKYVFVSIGFRRIRSWLLRGSSDDVRAPQEKPRLSFVVVGTCSVSGIRPARTLAGRGESFTS